MMGTFLNHVLIGVLAVVTVCQGLGPSRRGPYGAGVTPAAEFDCPEEFGYYPHPTDCTQYYVCVFGGALLESCTGGLMYSHELQTCDWPRNVGCGAEGADSSAPVSNIRSGGGGGGNGNGPITDVRDPRRHPVQQSQRPSNQVSLERQKQIQQDEISKHQLYADDLGPAEEVETDRQQRVYRGQPAALGQVARDRDGLRPQPATNTLQAPSGSRDKVVVTYSAQDSTFSGVDPMLTPELDMLFEHSDHNFLNNDQNQPRTRKKRQAPYRISYPPPRHPIPIPLHIPQPARPSQTSDEMHKYKLVFDPSVPSTVASIPRYVTTTPKSFQLSAFISPNITPASSLISPLRYSGLSVGDLVPPPLSLSEILAEVHPKRAPYRTIPSEDEGFVPIPDPSRPKSFEAVPNLVDKQVASQTQLSTSHMQFQRFGPGTPVPLFGFPPKNSLAQISPSSHVHEMKMPQLSKPTLKASQSYINERGERIVPHGNYRDPQQGPINGKTPLPPIPWVDERGKNHHLLFPPTTPNPDEANESKSGDESPEQGDQTDEKTSSFRDKPKLAHISEANDDDEDFGPQNHKRAQKPRVYDNKTKSKLILTNSNEKADPEDDESGDNEPNQHKQSYETSDERGEAKDKEEGDEPNEGEGEKANANNDEEWRDNSNRQPENDDHDSNRDGHEEHEEPQRTQTHSEELADFDYRKPTTQDDDFIKSPFGDDHSYVGPPEGFFSKMPYEDTKNPFSDPHFDYDKYIGTIAVEPSVNKLINSLSKDVERNERQREAKLKGDLSRTKGGEVAGGYEYEDRVNVDTPKPPRSRYVEEPFLWEEENGQAKDDFRAYDDKIFSMKSPFSAETHRELDFFKSGQNGKFAPYQESSTKTPVRNQYSNPFADPNFDFDDYLAKISGTTTTTTTPKPRIVEPEKDRKRLLKAPGSRQKYVTRPRGRIKFGMKENNKHTEDSKEKDSTEMPPKTQDRRRKRPYEESEDVNENNTEGDAKEDETEDDNTEPTQATFSDDQETERSTHSDNRATESPVLGSTDSDQSEQTTAYSKYPSKSPIARPFSFDLSTPRVFTAIRTDGSNMISHIHDSPTPQPTVEHSSFSTFGPDNLQNNFENAFALKNNFRGLSKSAKPSNTRSRIPTSVTKNDHFDVFGFSPEFSVTNIHLAPTESYEDLNPIKDIFPDDNTKIGLSSDVHNDDEDRVTETLSTNKNENIVKISHGDEGTSLRPLKSSVSFMRNFLPGRVRGSNQKDVTLSPSVNLSTVRPRLPSTAAASRKTSRLRPQPFQQIPKERSPSNLESSPSEVHPVLPLPDPTPTTNPKLQTTSQRAGGTGVASDTDKSVTAGRQRYGPKTTSFNTDVRETTFLRTATTNQPSRTGPSGRVEPSISPVQYSTTSRPSYNTSYQHQARSPPPQHFDSYYAVYDEDPELYRDVGDYNHYQNNQGGNQPQPFSRAQSYGKQDDQRQQQNVEIITQPQQRQQQQQQQDTLPANNAYVTSSFNVQSQDYNDNYNAQVDNSQYSPDDTFQPKSSSSIRHPNGLKRQTHQGSGSDSTPSQSEFKASSPFPFQDFNQPNRFSPSLQNYQTSSSPSRSAKLEPEISTPSSRLSQRPLSLANIPENFFTVGTPTPPTIRDSSEPSYYLRPPTSRPFTFPGKDFSVQPKVEPYSTLPNFQNSARPTNVQQTQHQSQFKQTGSVSTSSGTRSSTPATVSSPTPSSVGHEVRILPKSQSPSRSPVEDSQARNSFSRYNYYPSNEATAVTSRKVTFPTPTTPSWLPLDYFASVFQQPPRSGSQLLSKANNTGTSTLKLAPATPTQTSPVSSHVIQADLRSRLNPPKLDAPERFKSESNPSPAIVQPSRSELSSRHISSEQAAQGFVSSTPDPVRLRALLQQQSALDQISRLENVSALEKSSANSNNNRGIPSYATQDRVSEHKTPIVQTTFAQQTRDFSAKDYYQQARAFASDDQQAKYLQLRGFSTEPPVKSSSSTAISPSRYVSTEKPVRPEVPLTFVPIFDAQSYRSTPSPNSGSTLSTLAQGFYRQNNRPELEYITLQFPNKKPSHQQLRPTVSTGKPLNDVEAVKHFGGSSPTEGTQVPKVTAPTTSTTTTTTTSTTTTTAKPPLTTSVSFEHYYYGSEEYADDYLEDDYEILQPDNVTETSSSHPLTERVSSSTSRPMTTTRPTESSLHAVRGPSTVNIPETQSVRKNPSTPTNEHREVPTGRGRPIRFETLEIVPRRDSHLQLKSKAEEISVSTSAPSRNSFRSTTEALRSYISSTTSSPVSSEEDDVSEEVKIRGTPKSIYISRDVSPQNLRQRIPETTTKHSEELIRESTTAKTIPITTYRSRKRIALKSRPSSGSQSSEENETGFQTPSHSRRIRPRLSTHSPDSSVENISVQRQAKRTRLTSSRNPGSDEDRSDASPENLVPVHRSKSKYVSSITASGEEGYSSEGLEEDISLPRRTAHVDIDTPTTFRSRSRSPSPSRSRLQDTEPTSSPGLRLRVSGLHNVTDPPPTTYAPRVPFKVTTSVPQGVLPSSTSFENEVTPGDDFDASKAFLSQSFHIFRATVENAADYASTNSTLTQSSLTARAQLDSDSINGGNDSTTKPILRLRPTTVSPDSLTTSGITRNNGRGRGKATYSPNGSDSVNRGTPSSIARGTRPTLKPSTAIVSNAQEFVDIYRYPPSRPESVYPTPTVDKSAAKCRKDVCLLPDCNCGGKDIPGGLESQQVPQIVLLTFDDAVNDLNKGLYATLFERGRVNPNGCPISATFYVSHEWTDYSQVQNLYADGHEMASHSVSHSFGEQFSQKKWTKEIAGQREILAAYGGVKQEDIRGMRAPFLAVGGNKMFKMLYDSNFTYDSSMPVYENKPPSWPYTLDYKLFHDCMIPPCPTRSYPGVWEVPMVMWTDLNGGRCSMGDACSNPPTSDGVYKMLIKNFERHYTTNRAPFGLFYHAAWFTQPHHKEGFIAFLDTLVNMPDVWLVTNWQAIQWVRDPTPISRINSFQPWQCNYQDRPRRCNNPKVCNLWHKSGVRYMRTCQPCPDVYPWTGKSGVRNSRVDNDISGE